MALAAGSIGTWSWDVPGNRLMADEKFARLFGIEPGEAAQGLPYQIYMNAIHPHDRAYIEHLIANMVQGQGVYEAEHRVIDANAKIHWVVSRGKAEYDERGPCTYRTYDDVYLDEMRVPTSRLSGRRKQLFR